MRVDALGEKKGTRTAPKMNYLLHSFARTLRHTNTNTSMCSEWVESLKDQTWNGRRHLCAFKECESSGTVILVHSLQKESCFMVFLNKCNLSDLHRRKDFELKSVHSNSIFNLALLVVIGTSFNRFWFPSEGHSLTHVIDIIDVIRERVISTWANAVSSGSCFGHSRRLHGPGDSI